MISGPVGGPGGPPGSPGPGFSPGSGGFFNQWFTQDAEAHDIAARNSRIRGPATPPEVVQGERNELLYNPPLEVMLQAVVTLGEKTSDGHVIEAVAIPWLAFLEHLKRNPGAIHAIDWRKMELSEKYAAAWAQDEASSEYPRRAAADRANRR
jgi:hypothetical protein